MFLLLTQRNCLVSCCKSFGKDDDVAIYSTLLQKIKEAFLKEYATANGRLVSNTQTAYVLALNFDMLPESQRPEAAQRLAENVDSYDNHLTTGFFGNALFMSCAYTFWIRQRCV
jgi:alpha-L-rhamnosidase